MNLPTTRTRFAAGAAAVAFAATALLAGCSDSGTDDEPTATETTTEATTDDNAAAGTVEVIDQTNLLLETAQQTLEARDLTVEVVDVTGQNRPIDDPTAWIVVSQDPLSGEVETGSVVTLEVRRTDDPRS